VFFFLFVFPFLVSDPSIQFNKSTSRRTVFLRNVVDFAEASPLASPRFFFPCRLPSPCSPHRSFPCYLYPSPSTLLGPWYSYVLFSTVLQLPPAPPRWPCFVKKRVQPYLRPLLPVRSLSVAHFSSMISRPPPYLFTS